MNGPSPSPQTNPRKAKSLRDVQALSLALQNHFSSLDGFETIDVGGNPYIGASTILFAIVEINYDHITVENQVVSKFWPDPNEMEEDVSDIGEEIVRPKRKPRRPPKGIGKFKKTSKVVLSTKLQ